MIDSYNFLKSVLDSITDHVTVIDRQGNILFVNRSWIMFGQSNNCLITGDWRGVNYLDECDRAAATGNEYGIKAAKGIRKVINSNQELFYFEYPCHSPDEKRWFMMRTTPLQLQEAAYYVISHQNITSRKLAEEKVFNLSRLDGLTNIFNRRYFDEFFNHEWRRCARLNMPISLAILDIDHFKLLNDTYGHQAGDDCLKKIGAVLKKFCRRPSDICARYGGEEFAIVFGNTTHEQALDMTNHLLETIRALKIPNKASPTQPTVTASVGLATMEPNRHTTEADLIQAADKLLYAAKEKGRNQVAFKDDSSNLKE